MRYLLAVLALLSASCGSPQDRVETPISSESEEAPGAEFPQAQRANESTNTWTGTWKGEFGGTQEFIQLELSDNGRFRYELTSGPDTSCCAEGEWRVDQKSLTLTLHGGTCKGPGLSAYSHIYTHAADTFSIADPAYLEHVEPGEDGKLSGPVWMFERDPGKAPECP